jgi:hypothetical protein
MDMSLWAPSGWTPGAEITSLVGYVVVGEPGLPGCEEFEVPLAATSVDDPAMPAALEAAGYKLVGVPVEATPSPLSYCQGWLTVEVV